MYKKSWLAIIFLLQLFTAAYAQQELNYSVQANIIYHFTKYIDWPADKKSGSFIIGITGDSPLYDELKKNIAGKMVGDQKIVIKKFSSSSATFDCHILFISDDENSSLKKIVARTRENGMLLVSESPGFARRGSCINFSIVNDRLKLEINKYNIEQQDLLIASELLQLGILIK